MGAGVKYKLIQKVRPFTIELKKGLDSGCGRTKSY